MRNPGSVPIGRTLVELRAEVRAWRGAGLRVGFVPTMGALHEGHLSLVRMAKARADRVVVSLFVNPTQFAPTEDLDRYPRQEAEDARLLAGAGCDLLFAPQAGEMYPPGFSTTVTVGGVSQDLEGAFRPQMFGGVALVVSKLLNQVQADVAAFGEKDYQQLLVIRRMVRDLNIPTEIVAGPTVREADGLALSSRNAYLDPAQRKVAGQLNRVLKTAATRAGASEPVAGVEQDATAALLQAGFDKVDYVAIRRVDDLGVFAGPVDGPARVLAAVRIGATRLIDNMPVEAGE